MNKKPYSEVERVRLERILDENGWNITQLAQRESVTRQTIYNRMERYGIPRQPWVRSPKSPAPSIPPVLHVESSGECENDDDSYFEAYSCEDPNTALMIGYAPSCSGDCMTWEEHLEHVASMPAVVADIPENAEAAR
jgi:hypothetical protein